MNYNQKNLNRNDWGFSDKRNYSKQECWLCRPCHNNFPPELNWDCDDDYGKREYPRYDKFDKEDKFFEYDYQEDYENYSSGYENEEKEKFTKNDNRNKKHNCDNNQNKRPQHNCQKRCFCGFFKIFHC